MKIEEEVFITALHLIWYDHNHKKVLLILFMISFIFCFRNQTEFDDGIRIQWKLLDLNSLGFFS